MTLQRYTVYLVALTYFGCQETTTTKKTSMDNGIAESSVSVTSKVDVTQKRLSIDKRTGQEPDISTICEELEGCHLDYEFSFSGCYNDRERIIALLHGMSKELDKKVIKACENDVISRFRGCVRKADQNYMVTNKNNLLRKCGVDQRYSFRSK